MSLNLSPRNLLQHPLWQAEDLGKNLPDHPHATSVSLPLWQHVIGYEENEPAVVAAMHCGYPRFVVHPLVRQLFDLCTSKFAKPGEQCFAFPSARSARTCAEFVTEKAGESARVEALGINGIHAVVFADAAFEHAKKYWQHFGEIISSRRAEATLAGREAVGPGKASEALRQRIAGLTGAHPEQVYLYPTGMAALAGPLRAAQALRPGCKSVQLGFPYVDLLKIQSVTGPGVHFFPHPSDASLEAVESLLQHETLSAVFCEVPSNPLLQCVDLPRLSAMLRAHNTPLIVDDTAGTFANINVMPYADIVVSSLTKSFSGVGDVMAGSAVLSPQSPLLNPLRQALADLYENLFWEEDAVALEENSRDFEERMSVINGRAETLCEYLRAHSAVKRVYYPKYETSEHYGRLMKSGGGFGCLFSLLLHNATETAPTFYDRLRVCKGPSLGLNFTITCPYVLLAHYRELDWAEQAGLDRNLIRVSVGLEPIEELIERFKEALQ